MAVDAVVVLRSEGVAVVVDLLDGRLPALAHWGADPGELDLADAVTLIGAGVQPVAANAMDEPVRLSLLPEHWTGWAGRPGISGSRAGSSWSPRFTTTAARLDGSPLPVGPGPAFASTGRGRLEVEASDPEAGLDLVLRIELTHGGVLRCRATLTNRAEQPYTLDDLVLAYPVPPVARELLDLAGRWGRERAPQRRALTVGVHLREGRRGRTGADAATVLHLGTPGFGFAGGEVWGVHTAWSGNHTHYAELLASGEQVVGGGELLLPGEIRLGRDESYTSPWLYGSYGNGLDELARRFHRHLRARPRHPSVERPVTLNVWEAVYFDHRLEPLLELAERAAAVGVERFVLDDGWFGSRRDDTSGLGDWTVSRQVWPDGLHPLIDRVRGLGMQFGLWVEPEMANPDSDLARAHPEWLLATGGRQPVPSRHQQVVNLAVPECYAHIRDAILAILAEYDIGYLKWDHNRDLVDAGSWPSGVPGVHAQTAAVYRLLDELLAAHPGLEIESCSSGGARVDLAILERASRVWVSDCIDPHERQLMNRWTGQLLPPELLGSHIASGRSHTTGRVHDLDFRAATALFGHLGIEWDLRAATPSELAELAEWTAFYRRQRDLLATGDLQRADHPDPSVMITGIVAADRRRALFSHATTERSRLVALGRVRFPGLAADLRYRVTPLPAGRPPAGLQPPPWWGEQAAGGVGWSGVELPGSSLVEVGLSHAPVHPDHAVLYLVEAVGTDAGRDQRLPHSQFGSSPVGH
ncbi:MAG: alpha-galactosidase [Propionicimonas sp.]|nr:alpha-galactosidase [Propionicimonas sp.]